VSEFTILKTEFRGVLGSRIFILLGPAHDKVARASCRVRGDGSSNGRVGSDCRFGELVARGTLVAFGSCDKVQGRIWSAVGFRVGLHWEVARQASSGVCGR
jgi:hypothetical protein